MPKCLPESRDGFPRQNKVCGVCLCHVVLWHPDQYFEEKLSLYVHCQLLHLILAWLFYLTMGWWWWWTGVWMLPRQYLGNILVGMPDFSYARRCQLSTLVANGPCAQKRDGRRFTTPKVTAGHKNPICMLFFFYLGGGRVGWRMRATLGRVLEKIAVLRHT